MLKRTYTKKQRADIATKKRWIKENPPDEYGYWDCYLQISQLCLRRINLETLTIEHVVPKVRGKQFRHDLKNLRPSCVFCNKFKGSRTLESLSRDFPQLEKYV